MRLSNYQIAFLFLFGILLGYYVSISIKKEGFQSSSGSPVCSNCGNDYPCDKCDESSALCPPMPDLTKYILKTSIPPCPTCPDMSMYMLKTECPPAVDLSQYMLKSSIPKPEPIIIDNSKCNGTNAGECPPCPRPRCPETKCPGAVSCPACPPCERSKCPEKVVKCKTEDASMDPVRPYLTPLSVSGFGAA